jgi:hypothetical protein
MLIDAGGRVTRASAGKEGVVNIRERLNALFAEHGDLRSSARPPAARGP